MTEDEFKAWLHRQGKPATKAMESWKYRNPADFVTFGQRSKGEQMNRQSDKEVADSLLIEWYRWAKTWRPVLGAPRIAPSCRGFVHEKETGESDGYEAIHKREMEAVDFCLGSIAVPMQQAIGTEMRNREAKAKVWRDRSNHTFEQALHAVLPLMRKHRDLMALFN